MALENSETLVAISKALSHNGDVERGHISELLKLENHEIEVEKVKFADFGHYRISPQMKEAYGKRSI